MTWGQTGNFICLPEILTFYRRRASQTTGSYRRMAKAHDLVLAKAREMDAQATRKVEAQSLCNALRYQAFIACEAGEWRQAFSLLWRGFRSAPLTFVSKSRSWLLLLAIVTKSFLPSSLASLAEEAYLAVNRWLHRGEIPRQESMLENPYRKRLSKTLIENPT